MDEAWHVVRDRAELEEAFLSCGRSIPAAELDPLALWVEEFGATARGVHEAPYSCAVLRLGGRLVAGITWNKYAFEHFDAAAIGYAWVDSEGSAGSLRGRGLGSQAFGFALESARQASGGRLAWIILEANRPDSVGGAQDSTGFWRRRGFYSLDSARYAVPGLPFDPESGEAAGDDIGLELMVMPVGSPDGSLDTLSEAGPRAWIDRGTLFHMVGRIHEAWYGPRHQDFASPEAFARAQSHREALFADFAESLRVDEKGQVGLI